MKTLITILLIFTMLSLSAQEFMPMSNYSVEQNTYLHRNKEAIKTIALFTTSIVLSAVGDAYNDGIIGGGFNKVLGHALNAASTGLLVASPFILNIDRDRWLWYIVSYSFIRAGIFDASYNLTRGLPLGYVGNSSLWDKTLRGTRSPTGALLAGKCLFLVVGFSIPLNEF